MGDNNGDPLDDFFAKKDKKKKKTKGRQIGTELLPPPPGTPPNESNESTDQQLSNQIAEVKIDTAASADYDAPSAKEKKKQKKKKDKDGLDGSSRNEEDEWNAVSDEVDYSGLRISSKNISKVAEDEAAEAARTEPEYDEDGQVIEKSADASVWKKATSEPVEQPVVTAPAAAPLISEMPNVSDGKYVPPSRRPGATQLTAVSVKKPTRKKVAPNMNSQEDFPSLGAAPPPVDYDVSKFEKVRGGGMQQAQSQGEQPRLQTSNMYSALDRQ